MKNGYFNALVGSAVLLFFGTSCCWLSTLFTWIGVTSIFSMIECGVDNAYLKWGLLASLLMIISVYLHFRKKRREQGS